MDALADERFQLQVGLQTDPGRERPANEDALGGPESQPAELLARKGWLYVVADGMGGHVGGSLASDIAVRTAVDQFYRDPSPDVEESLAAAVSAANAAILAQAQDPAYQGMGSTLVAAVLRGSELHVANLGDSRAYLIRGPQVVQITQDHSWVEEQRRAGVLSAEEARNHPYSHVITRSLGSRSQVQVDLFAEALQPGDIVLLCSDGLWGPVSDGQIAQVASSRPPQRAADELVALANAQGGSDNISVIVIQVGVAAIAPPPARPAVGCSPVVASALLIGVGIIGLTMILFARGPGHRLGLVSPAPKTATPTWTRPAPTSAVATITTAWTPTPAPSPISTEPPYQSPTPTAPAPTMTLVAPTPVPSAEPTASIEPPSSPFSFGQLVRICAGCTPYVNLRHDPAGDKVGELEPLTELIIMGASRSARMPCRTCWPLTWWPVRTKGDQFMEGWVAEPYLESIPAPGGEGSGESN